jgi:Reprolysin (M12B) family zinc metalloprotease/ADAM cysteine-rich/Disintegrin
MFRKLGSIQKAHRYCKDLVNLVNALYTPLNIFIALKGVEIWNVKDEVDMSLPIGEILKSFLNYRETTLLKKFPNDNAQLLTDVPFGNTVVGLAPVGAMCSPSQSGAVSMDHSKVIAIVAATVAHEMGHNFGMDHDTGDCNCHDENGCIMLPKSSYYGFNQWSSCSIDQLNDALKKGIDFCLKDKPEKLFDSPTCGNGFVEPGEECDCGLPGYCDNPFCNPHTCMLTANSTCATGSCCDLKTCNLHSTGKFTKKLLKNIFSFLSVLGKVCRKAHGECDLPEFCNGNDEFCPEDVYKHNSDECGFGLAYCFQGKCRSHNDQCRKLWGKSSTFSEICHKHINTQGDSFGNCGLDRLGNFKACFEEDALCGTLQCRSHESESAEFKRGLQRSWYSSFNGNTCRGAAYSSIEEGFAPNSAKCGVDKVCSNQKCVSVDELKIKCPDCNGHGVCNSKGHCHCEEGWAPPFCNSPGDGGSIDSNGEKDESEFVHVWLFIFNFFNFFTCFLGFRLFIKIVSIFSISVVFCCSFFAGFKLYLRYSVPEFKKPIQKTKM